MNDALTRLLALDLSDGPLLILTHDNPDPDSLSSAAALRHLLRETRQLEAVVGYSGIVGRAENRAMLALLDLDVRLVNDADVASYRHVALIDAQPHTGNTLLPAGRIADIVIDHHPLREATAASRFYDVRPEIGASATMLTGYLRAASLEVPPQLATALLYGIRTETQDLGRETSSADREAFHQLFPLADHAILAAIARPRLSADHYRGVRDALQSARVGEGVLISALRNIVDPDFVPEMADYLVRLSGIESALVYGYFGGKMYLSIRSNDDTVRAGEWMRSIVEGLGVGGGHGMRAGGLIEDAGTISRLHETIEARFLSLTARAGALTPLIEEALQSASIPPHHEQENR